MKWHSPWTVVVMSLGSYNQLVVHCLQQFHCLYIFFIVYLSVGLTRLFSVTWRATLANEVTKENSQPGEGNYGYYVSKAIQSTRDFHRSKNRSRTLCVY